MCKFHNFSITRILREINVWDSRSAKSAILTHLEALNFEIDAFLHFMKVEIYKISQINKFGASKIAKRKKNSNFSTPSTPRFFKSDFTQNLSNRKFLEFSKKQFSNSRLFNWTKLISRKIKMFQAFYHSVEISEIFPHCKNFSSN